MQLRGAWSLLVTAEHLPGQNCSACENSEFRSKGSLQRDVHWCLRRTVDYGFKRPLSKLLVKRGTNRHLSLSFPKGMRGKKTKLIHHYCVSLQLKIQVSHVLGQEASEDGKSKAEIRKVHLQS